MALWLYPRALREFPALSYVAFNVRGQMDPLSVAVALVVYISRHHSDIYGQLFKFINLTHVVPADSTMLVIDPTSLCINIPYQGDNYVRTQIKNLSQLVQNPALAPLFGNTAESEEKLFDELLSIR